MNILEIAGIVTILASISAVAIAWLELRLKPLKKKVDTLETRIIKIDEISYLIVDGLLQTEDKPKRKMQ